ncbi:soluble guanylate cyclase 88E-like isoform X2 [Branchiostoma floridae x Branchiostoma belcheri]
MYGLLLENIHDFFKRVYGVDVWKQIRNRGGIKATSFVLNQSYPETFLLRLSTAACEYTGETQDDLMYDLGISLIKFYSRSGYDKVLRVLGRNIASFINGLDNLHEYYRYKYPKIKPPSFSCQEESSTGITVRYRSKRPGFLHMVRGLLKQLSKQFFEKDVKVEVMSEELKLELNKGVTLVHYRMHFDNTARMMPTYTIKPKKSLDDIFPVESHHFFSLFPFHIAFGREMVIFKVGMALREILPELVGERVNDVFFVVRPQHIEFTWDNVLLHSNNVFELISDSPVERRNLALPCRGSKEQMFSKSSKPRGVRVENVDPTTVKVKWEPPKSLTQQQQIHGYQVYYQKVTEEGEAVGEPMRADVWNAKTTVAVGGLDPDASYAVQVVGYTKTGEGERSEAQVACTTLKAPANIVPEVTKLPAENRAAAHKEDGGRADEVHDDIARPFRSPGTVFLADAHPHERHPVDAKHLHPTAANKSGKSKYLSLKGQMRYVSEWNAVLFLGTPVMGNLEDLFNYGLYLTDLCMHDCTREMIINGTQPSVELKLAVNKQAETNDELGELVLRIDKEKRKADELLYSMIPRPIAERLRNGEAALNTCSIFHEVSVLFADIVGFTDICRKVSPMELVTLLNECHTLFDDLAQQHNVFKVETVGDEYMVESGAPIPNESHAFEVADFGLDMMKSLSTTKNPSTGDPIKVRIGMNTGTVVAGVVGLKVPKYCLFGDAVNTASRMESTGLPMHIHISEDMKKCLKKAYIIKERGVVTVKGKGRMKTYWLAGRKDEESSSDDSDNTTSGKKSSRLMVPREAGGSRKFESKKGKGGSYSGQHSPDNSDEESQSLDGEKQSKVCVLL